MAILPAVSSSAMHGAVVPIAQLTSNGTENGFGFSNIPQGYQDLFIMINGRTASPNTETQLRFNFNNDTSSSNYSSTTLNGNGSSASSTRETNSTGNGYAGIIAGNSLSSSLFASITLHILNYASTSTYKNMLIRSAIDENGAGQTALGLTLWRNTNAISVINFGTGYTLTSGSTATLYGIRTVGQ